MKVVLCLPSHGGAYREHEKCLSRLRHAEPSWDSATLEGAPCIDIARATVAEEALRMNADMLLWLDADMVFSADTCRAVVKEAWERHAVVGCVYAGKKLGSDPQCVFKGGGEIPFFELGKVLEVHAIGFGVVAFPAFMLENIASFHKLKPRRVGDGTFRPWFTDDPSWDLVHSDDYAFCKRAREAGFKVFADTRQRVGHVGLHTFHLEDMAGRPLKKALILAQEERPQEAAE